MPGQCTVCCKYYWRINELEAFSCLNFTLCLGLQFSSVQSLSCVWLSVTLWTARHTRPPCPSPTPGACSNSCPSNQWCHPTISSSVVPFSSFLPSFPASGSSPVSQFQWSVAWFLNFLDFLALTPILFWLSTTIFVWIPVESSLRRSGESRTNPRGLAKVLPWEIEAGNWRR